MYGNHDEGMHSLTGYVMGLCQAPEAIEMPSTLTKVSPCVSQHEKSLFCAAAASGCLDLMDNLFEEDQAFRLSYPEYGPSCVLAQDQVGCRSCALMLPAGRGCFVHTPAPACVVYLSQQATRDAVSTDLDSARGSHFSSSTKCCG
jgi:hypothetical protein